MPGKITEICKWDNGQFRIRREKGDVFSVFAKDELDAYMKATAFIEEEQKKARVVIVCITAIVLALLSILTFACERSYRNYEANMQKCVTAGKSYISEAGGYSCRDAVATLKE